MSNRGMEWTPPPGWGKEGMPGEARLTPCTGGRVSREKRGAHPPRPPPSLDPICPGPRSGLDPAPPLLRTIGSDPHCSETPGMAEIQTLRSYGDPAVAHLKCILLLGTSRKPVPPCDLEQGLAGPLGAASLSMSREGTHRVSSTTRFPRKLLTAPDGTDQPPWGSGSCRQPPISLIFPGEAWSAGVGGAPWPRRPRGSGEAGPSPLARILLGAAPAQCGPHGGPGSPPAATQTTLGTEQVLRRFLGD